MKKLLILLSVSLMLLILPLVGYGENEFKFPEEVKFLEKAMPVMVDVCTEKATGKEAFCIIFMTETAEQFFTAWDDDGLYEAIKMTPEGMGETIYKRAEKLKL